MAESKIKFKKCSLLPNEGSGLDEEYNVLAGAPLLNYYESITSPSISATLGFLDIDQVISRKGIFGGEYIDIIIQIDGYDDFKLTQKDHNLFCNSVRDVVTTENKQMATLDFISVEAIINETARVNKKFTGNVSQTVFEVLIGDKKGLQTSKKLNKDEAANSYSFVGNLKKPFDTIQWLQPKTQSSKKSFGFLFFENFDGYHFRSIEKLLEQEPSFTYTQTSEPYDEKVGGFEILQNKVTQTNDIFQNMRRGMYANRTIYVDIQNGTKDIVDFKIGDFGLKRPPKLLKDIDKSPTRLMFRVNDFATTQKGSKKKDEQPANELAVYQNKSYIRNELLFSQEMKISTPLNPDLRVGQMIEIKLPLKKGKGDAPVGSYGNDKTNDPSGKYLVSELRHLVGRQSAETQLTLIRDVFSA
tara:strand:- start:40 stop:1281 length:1242 start_codon:yes stop_codon:yes gene_type:complete